MKKFALLTALLFAFATVVATQIGVAQDKASQPSPPASAECKFADGKTIKVDYSSPRMRGRKIYGHLGLVPFGQVWRTGANAATTFVTTANLTVGGKDVPAGSYTIFTIPNAEAWTLIISKKTGEWGTVYPGEKDDLVRAPMSVLMLTVPIENFTIYFERGTCGLLYMDWENTRASLEINEK